MRDSLEPHESVENSRHVRSGVVKSHTRSLQFHSVSTWSQSVSSPSQSSCPVISSGTEHKPFSRGNFSSTQSLDGYKTWVSNTPRGQRVPIRETVSTPYTKGHEQMMRPSDSYSGLGYSSSSLFSWLSLSSANLLYREDFLLSTHGVGMAWISTGGLEIGLIPRMR